MAGVGIGVEQADGDGLHAIGFKVRDHRGQFVQHQRLALVAVGVQAPRDLPAQIARYKGRRFGPLQVEVVGAVGPGDFEDVAKAGGGDQRGLDATAFSQRIDHYRCAVGKKVDL